MSRSLRLRARITEFMRKERDEQFTRDDQLMMVIIGHFLLLGGVILITLFTFGPDLSGWPPVGFIACESGIIGACVLVGLTRPFKIVDTVDRKLVPLPWLTERIERRGERIKRRWQAAALLFVFVLQFVALYFLLDATGGPIDSPFAPMALAIAVFTPFIVNKWWTVSFIIALTIAYYAVFVATFGFAEETKELPRPASAAEGPLPAHALKEPRPSPLSFVAVNVLVLILSSVTILRRRDTRSITITRVLDAPRDSVWRAWTEPDRIGQWFGVDGYSLSSVDLDVRKGGIWKATMSGQNGSPEIPWNGKYREVKEPELLVFTVSGQPSQGHDLVTVVLTDLDDRTEMMIQQSDDGRYDRVKEGWTDFADRIAEHLAEAAASR